MGDMGKQLPNTKLVVLKGYPTLHEADIVRSILQGEEIDAIISNENMTALGWHLTKAFNPRGIEVLVLSSNLDRAREILELHTSIDISPEEALHEFETVPVAPCEKFAFKAARSSLFAWLFPPLIFQAIYYCHHAGKASLLEPPSNEAEFQRNLRRTWAVGLPFCTFYGIVLYYMLRDIL